MFYEKKIKYLEYRKNGEKIQSVGFMKIEVKNGLCNLLIQVSGLPVLDNLRREVRIRGGKKETCLGEIVLQEGRGCLRMREQNAERLGQDGIRYEELEEFMIVIGKGRELVCNWKKEEGKTQVEGERQRQERMQEDQGQEEELIQRQGQLQKQGQLQSEGQVSRGQTSGGQANPGGQGIREEQEVIKEQEGKEEQAIEEIRQGKEERKEVWGGEKVLPEGGWKENGEMDVRAAELRFGDQDARAEESIPGRTHDRGPRRLQLREDKWQQLSSIYPHIAPFNDEREYLSITPADFVILQRQYYRLVSNSFLLHGFYNYNHLILTRIERTGAVRYYVGVPGNFYEKERQVAIMFGFESFECKREPVEQGDFGYYCIRVDL